MRLLLTLRARARALRFVEKLNLSLQVRFLAKSSDNDINAVDDFGNSALHVAVERGHMNVVVALLEEGANVGLQNSQVHTGHISYYIHGAFQLVAFADAVDAAGAHAAALRRVHGAIQHGFRADTAVRQPPPSFHRTDFPFTFPQRRAERSPGQQRRDARARCVRPRAGGHRAAAVRLRRRCQPQNRGRPVPAAPRLQVHAPPPPPPLCSGCDFGLRNGNLDCTKVLIAHSCDIEARAAGSLTALHIAVQDNRCAPAAACAAAA